MLASRIGGRAINTASNPFCLSRSPSSLTASLSRLFARFLITAFPSFVLVENPIRLLFSPDVLSTFNMNRVSTYVLACANTTPKSRLLLSLCSFGSTKSSARLRRMPGPRQTGIPSYLDGQFPSSLSTACFKHFAAGISGHLRHKSMYSFSSSRFWLKSSFTHKDMQPPMRAIIPQ